MRNTVKERIKMFLSDSDIRATIHLLLKRMEVPARLIKDLIGDEKHHKVSDFIYEVEGRKATDEDLLKIMLMAKGPEFFAGSSEAIREIRRHMLRTLQENKLIELYNNNPVSGKNITSPSYMIKPLSEKRWVKGGRWARQFIAAFNIPIIFAGIASIKDHKADSIMDIEPRKQVPPLAEFQVGIKNEMLKVLNRDNTDARCIVSLPTGAGKTRVAVESFIEWMQPRFSNGKYLFWIAQSEELCEQAIECIVDMWQDKEFPESLRVYRYFGGHKFKQSDDLVGGVVVASIQQLRARIMSNEETLIEMLQGTGAMIIDEAHHATAKSYQLLFAKARELVGERLFPICGLTATPGRSNEETMELVSEFQANLIHPTFKNDVTYSENPLQYFRDEKYLAMPEYILMQNEEEIIVDEEDLDGEQEFTSEFLQTLANDTARNEWILDSLRSVPKGSSVLVYACTVDHAEMLAMFMNVVGRKAVSISAHTPKALRRSYIDAFKKGEIEFLFNYGVLTTGFDAPITDHLFILRPTSSSILYEQIVGRGLRGPKFGGTESCKIVDFSQNIIVHGKPLAFARFTDEWNIKKEYEVIS